MGMLSLSLQAGKCNIRLNGNPDDLFSVPFEGVVQADIFDSSIPLRYMKDNTKYPVDRSSILTPGVGYFPVEFESPRDLYIVTIEGTEPSEIEVSFQ